MREQKQYFGNAMIKLSGLMSLFLTFALLGFAVLIGTLISETWNLVN